jgi:hypothetical protein
LKGLLLEPSAEPEFLAQPTCFFGQRPFVEQVVDPIIVLGRLGISREREREREKACELLLGTWPYPGNWASLH